MAALSPRSVPWLAALFVVGCTLAAFLNSLDGEFLMDDFSEILDNPLMESPWPPWRVMLEGHELPARPIPYLTFAIDHSLWGKRPFGYHLTSLAIHVAAALALFFLARTTLSSPRLRDAFGEHADVLAAQWNTRWLTASVVASAAAMFSKETAVVLPLLIASYDWLLCGKPPPPAGRRLRFYAALCTTWGLLGLQMVVQSRRYEATGAFAGSPFRYFLTQPRMILYYLRLAFWPTGLSFDLAFPILETWREILPSLIYLLALGLVATYGLVRRKSWAWPGAAFFLALAPSSSFVPLGAVYEEYRMYLALAAVACIVVLGGHSLIRRWTPPGTSRTVLLRGGAAVALAAVVGLVVLTQDRNRVYAIPGGVWTDAIEKGWAGTRAFWNVAVACDLHDGVDEAIRFADEVFSLNHGHNVYEYLADRRLRRGDAATAERYLRHAVETQAEEIAKGELVPVRTAAAFILMLNIQGKHAEATSLAATYLDRVRATLGDDHPWTRELVAIRDRGASTVDTIGVER